MHRSLESEIELREEKLLEKYRESLSEMLEMRKVVVQNEYKFFDMYEFEAYQALAPVITADKHFTDRYEQLFFMHKLVQHQKIQEEKLRRFLIDIRKQDLITVTITNEIDFSSPEPFQYIRKNILPKDFEKQEVNHIVQAPLEVFRTSKSEWGLKGLLDIKKGEFY